jgi:hypothetical protein
MSLPGDELVPHPMVEWTRALTIDAPPEAVWPWLAQMGYGHPNDPAELRHAPRARTAGQMGRTVGR